MKPTFRQFLPLYAVILLSFLGYSLTIVLFIPMLLDKQADMLPMTASISTRSTLSGLLLAMYPLGQFLGAPIIGSLSDYFGRQRVLFYSLFACVFGFAGMALSIQFHLLALLFLSSFLTGLCESNMAISQSVISDSTKDTAQKTKLIGYAYSACSLGYMAGPILGGTAGSLLGYSGPFWFAAMGVLGLTMWIFYGFDDHFVPNKEQTLSLLKSMTAIKSIFYQRKLLPIYAINFVIFFAVQGLYRVVPLYLVDKWSPSLLTYSLLIAYVSLLCFFANLLILGRLAKWFSTTKLLAGLLIIGAILIWMIVVPAQFHWIWLTYGLAVMPTVMALPLCTSWLSHHAAPEEQGQVLGNNQALLVLGESSSAAIGGLIAAIMVPLPIVIMGALLLLVGIIIARMKM